MTKKALVAVAVVATFIVIGSRHWNRPAGNLQSANAEAHPIAPDFSLNDLSGRPLTFSNYRGKVILLNFWATWCAPCRSEIPRFVDLQKTYGSRGLQVVGISLDEDTKPVFGFYKQSKMNYPVAVADAKLAEQYGGVLGLPVSFVIGRDGRIYAKHIGEADVSLIELEIKSLL